MKPEQMNDICRQAFLDVVFHTAEFKNRKYCYIDPFRGKDLKYHITLVDKETGYGLTVPLDSKSCMLLEKEDIKNIFTKVMRGLHIAIKRHPKSSPVDYHRYPIKANKKTSILDKIEKNDKTEVEIFYWSKILV